MSIRRSSNSNDISIINPKTVGVKKSYSNNEFKLNESLNDADKKAKMSSLKKSFGKPAFANDIVNEEFTGELNKQFVRRHKDKENKRRSKAGRGNKSAAQDSQGWLQRDQDYLDQGHASPARDSEAQLFVNPADAAGLLAQQ